MRWNWTLHPGLARPKDLDGGFGPRPNGDSIGHGAVQVEGGFGRGNPFGPLGKSLFGRNRTLEASKSDPAAALKVLRYGAEVAAQLCIALEPFLPHGAQRLANQLNWFPSDHERHSWWLGLNGGAYLKEGDLLAAPTLLLPLSKTLPSRSAYNNSNPWKTTLLLLPTKLLPSTRLLPPPIWVKANHKNRLLNR